MSTLTPTYQPQTYSSRYGAAQPYAQPIRSVIISPQGGSSGIDLTKSYVPSSPESLVYIPRPQLAGTLNTQSHLAPRKELDLYDNFMSSQDDFTPEIKDIVGMYMDTPMDLTDVLVYGHESATRPDNINQLAKDRPQIVKMHQDLKKEAIDHRARVAKIVNDNKHVFPVRTDPNGQHLRNAIADINNPPPKPEKTGHQLKELKDDITVLLNKEITCQPENKYFERQRGIEMKNQMYPTTIIKEQGPTQVISTPSKPTIKINLTPEDRYISHEVIKNNPNDDAKVLIQKQPVRSVSPIPVYRPQTVISSPSPPPKKKSPTKSIVQLVQSSIEEYQTTPPVERNLVPVRNDKNRESVLVTAEKVPNRGDDVKYWEARHPYLSDSDERPKFLAGATTKSFEVQDGSQC